MLIKAASMACMLVPEANSSWQGTHIRRYKNVDMSVAVQTDHGLITPIVKGTNLKGISQISKDMKGLLIKAKDQKLKPEEFIGGTFTISNLGMMDINNFTAIINPPQACILAVGKANKKVEFDLDSKDPNKPFKIVSKMHATLSCDHRVVDGAIGAKWVSEFRKFIEQPELMLL
jgi:pyruvate dehydrogenase E2 component (dihydrolipoamide acetyltransferase)